jgi:hypothetical protein
LILLPQPLECWDHRHVPFSYICSYFHSFSLLAVYPGPHGWSRSYSYQSPWHSDCLCVPAVNSRLLQTSALIPLMLGVPCCHTTMELASLFHFPASMGLPGALESSSNALVSFCS